MLSRKKSMAKLASMVNQSVSTTLTEIIQISRQLLSLLASQSKEAKADNLPDDTTVEEADSPLITEKIFLLTTNRNALILQAFKLYTQEQLRTEVVLLNDMLLLDQKISSISQINKQLYIDKIKALRKSKKVSRVYRQL